VATAPYVYSDGANSEEHPNLGMGYGDMSNVFERSEDGFLYVFANSRNDYREMKKGHCLMRTRPEQLAEPGSWRGWGGNGFNISFVNPYLGKVADPTSHVCAPLNISFAPHHLGWSTHHKHYIAVGTSGGVHVLPNGSAFHGIGMVFALSTDLLNWGQRYLLKPAVENIALHVKEAYPTILDPVASRGLANMDHVGSDTGYLYYMHSAACKETSFRCRDIWRQRIAFAPTVRAMERAKTDDDDGDALSAPPNVLLFAVDDLRAEFGHAYQQPEVLTPHLDQLAGRDGAVTFRRSYVQYAHCVVSRSSILSGRRPGYTSVRVG
jgi:hypothetical protein